jgi:hypothetical protein
MEKELTVNVEQISAPAAGGEAALVVTEPLPDTVFTKAASEAAPSPTIEVAPQRRSIN